MVILPTAFKIFCNHAWTRAWTTRDADRETHFLSSPSRFPVASFHRWSVMSILTIESTGVEWGFSCYNAEFPVKHYTSFLRVTRVGVFSLLPKCELINWWCWSMLCKGHTGARYGAATNLLWWANLKSNFFGQPSNIKNPSIQPLWLDWIIQSNHSGWWHTHSGWIEYSEKGAQEWPQTCFQPENSYFTLFFPPITSIQGLTQCRIWFYQWNVFSWGCSCKGSRGMA